MYHVEGVNRIKYNSFIFLDFSPVFILSNFKMHVPRVLGGLNSRKTYRSNFELRYLNYVCYLNKIQKSSIDNHILL